MWQKYFWTGSDVQVYDAKYERKIFCKPPEHLDQIATRINRGVSKMQKKDGTSLKNGLRFIVYG